MKRYVTLNTVYRLTLITLFALFLSACGSSSNNSTVPTYTGNTNPAVINSDNAQEITTKAIGVGFIDEIDAAGVTAIKSLSKGLATPDGSLTPIATKATGNVLMYLSAIFSGNVLPGSQYAIMSDANFPNLSEGAYTRTLTSDDEKSFTITYTLTDARHFSGSASDACIYTLDGTIIESVTFEYTEEDTNEIGGWADKTLEEKYESLEDSSTISPVRKSLSCTGFSNHTQRLWTPESDATLETDKFGAGFDGYSAYSNTQESNYDLDGSYSTEVVDTDTMDDENLGMESWTLANTFKGQLAITDHTTNTLTDEETTTSLTMADGSISFNLSELLNRALADGLITETSNNGHMSILTRIIPLPAGDMDVIIRGTVTFTSSESGNDGEDAMELTFGNAAGNFLEFKKTIDTKTVTDTATEPNTLISENETVDVTLKVAGAAQISYDSTGYPTKIVVAPETRTMSLSVTSGNLSFTGQDVISLEYTDGNVATEKRNTTLTASLSGAIEAEYMDARYSLTGAITADASMVSSRYYDEKPSEAIVNILVTLNNLHLTSDIFHLAFHGTLELTMDQINESNTVELDMTFSTNGKTYLFDDYLISMSSYYLDKSSKKPASSGIYLEGRFYHPDYGYVDVSTRGNTFDMDFDELMPYAGSLTVTGADDSAAILKAEFEYDLEPIFWYTVSVDEDGNGSYELVTEDGTWPDIDGLLYGLPMLPIGR